MDMQVSVDFSLFPVCDQVSIFPYVEACQRVLTECELSHELHAWGTIIHGEWDQVFLAIEKCHQTVHALGAERITSSVKIGTRQEVS